MTGIFKTTILGKVTQVTDGTAKKSGKYYFRANVNVPVYNFSSKKYDNRLVNVVGFDKVAEAMKKIIKPGCALWAEGDSKAGTPFKTNSGQEITTTDLIARDWCLAGVVPERDVQQSEAVADEEGDEGNPFA